MEPPSLRTLQKFCRPFRLELRQSRLTKTERFETPPGHQMQIDFGEDDVLVGGEIVRVHFFVARMSYSRRIFARAYFSENQVIIPHVQITSSGVQSTLSALESI